MTARTGGRRRRGAWTLMVALVLAAGCGDGSRERPAPATGAAQPTPATTAGEIRAKPCLEAGEAARLFQFPTGDGSTLVGLTLGRGRTGLVLGHQLGSDLCEWLPPARAFAKRGYRVLVFDFAGFGDSRPGPDSRVDTDVIAATAELRRRGAERVVLVGSSMGSTAALAAATRIRTGMAEFGDDAPRVLAAVLRFITDPTLTPTIRLGPNPCLRPRRWSRCWCRQNSYKAVADSAAYSAAGQGDG